MKRHHSRRLALLLSAVLLAACSDADPIGGTAPPPEPPAAPVEVTSLACTVEVRTGATACGAPAPAGGARGDIIVGGQRQYVLVQSSNFSITDVADPAARDTLGLDVTIQNLLPQALGTTDGVTTAPQGVRLFFHVLPIATAGSGQVGVANADGTETYTGSEQPYYQYGEVLDSGEVSQVRRWKFAFQPAVQSFHFRLYVSAPVQYPNGWVDIRDAQATQPSGTARPVTATVRDFVGRTLPAEPLTWTSSDPQVARLTGTGPATASLEALRVGSATLTAATATRPGRPVTVSVTQGAVAAVVNAGRTGLNAATGQLLPDSVVARVVDVNGNPVPNVIVHWQASGGGALSPVSATTRADGTVRAAWTLGAISGVQEARAVLPAYMAIAPAVVQATAVTQGVQRTWTGGSALEPTAWADPDNWAPRGVPTSLDTVVVGAAASGAGRVPTLSAHSVAGELRADGTITLGRGDLTVVDSASVAGLISGTGTLVLRGGATLGGELPGVVVNAATAADTVRLTGRTRATGSFTVQVGALVLSGRRLRVDGAFTNSGRLVMRSASDTLSVGGKATFRETAALSAGTTELQGDFEATYCTCAYGGTPAHTTVFNGTVPQRAQFQQFNTNFGALVVDNPAGVTFDGIQTTVATGLTTFRPGALARIPAGKSVVLTGNLVLELGSSVVNHGTFDVRGTITNNSGSPNPVAPNPAL